jgi:hypothetical protein
MGKWDGDILTVTTTHLKVGWIRRNGIPRSDRPPWPSTLCASKLKSPSRWASIKSIRRRILQPDMGFVIGIRTGRERGVLSRQLL